MLGRHDLYGIQEIDHWKDIKIGLKELGQIFHKSTLQITSKFYRLENKQSNLIYYSAEYNRTSINYESSYVQFMKPKSTSKYFKIMYIYFDRTFTWTNTIFCKGGSRYEIISICSN
jgi:hypothetical protein